jgi:hypothetical protein
MAFTTWDALITEIKNNIQAHLSDNCAIGQYELPGGKKVTYRSVDELFKTLKYAMQMKALEDTEHLVSYGYYED